jgi:hypothetical protein
MRWYRYDRMTFNTSSLRGLLVRVFARPSSVHERQALPADS